MRESRTYGSVRGALSNGRPYRDRSAIRESSRRACQAVPDFAVCPEGRVSPVEEESTQIIVDKSGS